MNTILNTDQQAALDSQVVAYLRANPSKSLQSLAEGTRLKFQVVRQSVHRLFQKHIVNTGDCGSEFEVKFYVRKNNARQTE